MSKLRILLQLYLQGKSKLFISKYLEVSRNTVDKYVSHLLKLGLSIDDLNILSDAELDSLFFVKPEEGPNDRLMTLHKFFPGVEKRITKPGVTIYSMWKEYIKKHPDGFRMTRFYEYYKRWSKKVKPVMHIQHKAGDKMYVDYAGKTLELVEIIIMEA